MSIYFLGTATVVAQLETGSIDTVDGTPADNTFTVTIGGVAISQVGDTDVATTAAALVALLNASTHPYFAAVTWANPSAGTITGTADTAGCPFVAALTETGAGTGSVTDFATTTASAGPNHWDTATNWSGGAVPVDTDDVILAHSSVNICWGLDQSAVNVDSMTVEKTFTGRQGLDYTVFATSADGETVSSTTVPEYRETVLELDIDALDIRRNRGPGSPAGSPRLLFNLGTNACTVTIEDTASKSVDGIRPVVQITATSATTDVFIQSAPGGVGIGTERPGLTSTVRKVSVTAPSTVSSVTVGIGTTITTYEQTGGANVLQAAATVTTTTVNGGTLLIDGAFLITTLTVNAGKCWPNNVPAAGNALTTLALNGGIVDGTTSSKTRTWATVTLGTDTAVLAADDNVVTITTLNEPDGPYTLTAVR